MANSSMLMTNSFFDLFGLMFLVTEVTLKFIFGNISQNSSFELVPVHKKLRSNHLSTFPNIRLIRFEFEYCLSIKNCRSLSHFGLLKICRDYFLQHQ